IETEVGHLLEKIDSLGGMLPAIESGWIQSQIQEAAYAYQLSVERKERIIVGVNEFKIEEDQKIPIHVSDPALEAAQIENVKKVRASRDERSVREAIRRLEDAARGSENLMPHIVAAVEAYTSVGEICDAFRRVHGLYQEAVTI